MSIIKNPNAFTIFPAETWLEIADNFKDVKTFENWLSAMPELKAIVMERRLSRKLKFAKVKYIYLL